MTRLTSHAPTPRRMPNPYLQGWADAQRWAERSAEAADPYAEGVVDAQRWAARTVAFPAVRDGVDETSGPAGPDRSDIVDRVELRDALAEDADAAIGALRAAGLVVDVDRSRRGQDGLLAEVTVTDAGAAARILDRL